MSISVEIDTSELDSLINGLVLFEVNLTGNLLFEEVVIIGERVLELAREKIPFKTGAARDSLQMIVDQAGRKIIIGSDGGIGPDGVTRIYLRYLELGTSKMAARPFLFPSVLQAIEEFRKRFPQTFTEMARVRVGKKNGI